MNLALAEEVLSLSPTERAKLARLLIDSLRGDPRTDEEIKRELETRLNDLISGRDALAFEQVFAK